MRTLILTLTVTLLSTAVFAQGREPRNFSLERLRPAMDHHGVLDVDWAAVPEHLEWEAAFLLGYVNDPLVLNIEQDNGEVERVASVVGNRVTGSLIGAIGLYDWVQLGVELPVVLYQGRGGELDQYNSNVRDLAAGGVGDLRIAPKVRVLRAQEFFIDLAVIPGFTFPTASSRAYLGDRMMTFVPEVAVSKKIAMVRVATNIGFRVRSRTQTQNMVIDDELTYRAGVAYDFAPMLEVPLEAAMSLSGATGLKAPFQKVPRNPLELLFGANYQVTNNVLAFAGFGAGLSAGYSTPDFRLFAGARFVPGEEPPPPAPVADLDGDGLLDTVDQCPSDPEDKDQFEDEDGCPDPDNDADGVLDAQDQCPMDPEDIDQFEDDNGCPDGDNDGDGIADVDDECPLQAETQNGWEDEDGCPEDIPDSDGDGIADNADKCKEKPEDKDGFEDMDGCPDPDNDSDGVMDIVDQCPMEPGTIQSSGCPDADRDGDQVIDQLDVCPDTPGSPEFSGCPKKQLVKLSAEKIEILEKVYFGTNSDQIKEQSFQLLDSVAKVLNEHQEIQKIRIEGHTDSRGAAEYNQHLSQLRASSVRTYLISKGVAEARLDALGIGEDKPIASNDSTKGRAANRRVEFLIVSEDEEKSEK